MGQLHESGYVTTNSIGALQLTDTDLSLESFIISNTRLSAVDWWSRDHGATDEGMRTFNAHHVYFQNEQQGEYVALIVDAMMSG